MITYRKTLSLVIGILFGLSATANAFVAPQPWTSVGSAGIVDESDTAKVEFSGGIASLKSGFLSTTSSAIIRYNVTWTDGLVSPGNAYRLTVRFRDNGVNAQVTVRLKEVDLNTGAITEIMFLDSNQYAQSSNYQTRTIISCSNRTFDFANKAYFVEAQMISTPASVLTYPRVSGIPGLAAIKIDRGIC